MADIIFSKVFNSNIRNEAIKVGLFLNFPIWKKKHRKLRVSVFQGTS